MSEKRNTDIIEFTPVTPDIKQLYLSFLSGETQRGCEFTFANLCLWGQQNYAVVKDHFLLFSKFSSRTIYPYPLGKGDKKAVLDLIIADAKAKGIPCCISGLGTKAKQTLEELYPGRFTFRYDDGSFDFVYDINDLADLNGKKYHAKRNHLNRFREAYPDYRVEHIDESNLPKVKQMAQEWYASRLEENPDSDFNMEQTALDRAFRSYDSLGFEGLMLINGGDILAFTMASRLSEDTFDVHFEKARPDIQGAYAAINCELARYIRDKYPEVKFLDREEDMGIEGLRKAKQSYYPHHQVEKCFAWLSEEKDGN